MRNSLIPSLLIVIGISTGNYVSPQVKKSPPKSKVNGREVRLHLKENFSGSPRTFILPKGLRQLLVQNVSEPWHSMDSINIGDQVGVMLFQKKNFKFEEAQFLNLVSSINNMREAHPKKRKGFRSMIIYPRIYGNPLGVLAGNTAFQDFRFFWLPQSANTLTLNVANLANLMLPMDFIQVYTKKNRHDVAVILYPQINFKGKALTLPIKGKGNRYYLRDNGLAGQVKSLKVLEIFSLDAPHQRYLKQNKK